MSALPDTFADERCRLFHGDMRHILPRIGVPVHMVMSDPPYRLTAGGNSTGEMKGCFAHGQYNNSGALFDMVDWSEMAMPIFAACRPDADAVIMSSDRELQDARAGFEAAGFRFHRLLVWDKGTATPNRWYMPNCEFALYLWKGRARTIVNPSSKALIKAPQRDVSARYLPDWADGDQMGHPTEKPVALLEHWIRNSTDPGDWVLDPFMGSGATGVAALRAGRRFVGIEKSRLWFEVSRARVAEALDGVRPAASAPVEMAVQGGLF
ncbi:DNA-methyltransferase [Marinovum algicola]|uniref:DNA-methyltransferase n=1 Tax=Marinovum algicola TaxID=42444 RepID=UPI003B52E792